MNFRANNARYAILFAILYPIGYSQIVKFERDQPFLNVSTQLMSCCSLAHSSNKLWNCIREAENHTWSISNFTLLSFATPNILDFASFSYAVNLFYANQNRYNFRYFTSNDGANFEPRDPRWNKVCKINTIYVPLTARIFLLRLKFLKKR